MSVPARSDSNHNPEEGKMDKAVLQKVCYFVGVLTGLDLQYDPYFYGPYSRALASFVDDLVTHSILVEKREDRRGYSYELIDGRFPDRFRETCADEHSLIVEATHRVTSTRMAGSANSLSIAAKVHSILTEKATAMSVSELGESARSLGWAIEPSEVTDVAESLRELDLVA